MGSIPTCATNGYTIEMDITHEPEYLWMINWDTLHMYGSHFVSWPTDENPLWRCQDCPLTFESEVSYKAHQTVTFKKHTEESWARRDREFEEDWGYPFPRQPCV